MNDFSTATPCVSALDPSKRVNYVYGLVLGVDEFRQEAMYFLEKLRRENRSLHGFGTVWGLAVDVPATVDPPEVQVAPGLALSPSGHEICVPSQMCAQLNDWLTANAAALQAAFGAPPFGLSACVVLCWRECATDIVPLPGQPCQSASDTRAPSRLADAFNLLLCPHTPDMGSPPLSSPPSGGLCACPVHSAVAGGEIEFGRLLQRVDITSSGGPYATIDQLTAAVQQIPTQDPWSSPPPIGTPLYVHPADAHDALTAMARVWITDVLPVLLGTDNQASCGASGSKCVQLAQLTLTVAPGWTVQGGASGVVVDDTQRPILLSTSLLQSWMLGGGPIVGS